MLHIATETQPHTRINVTSFFANFNPGDVAETSPNEGPQRTRSLHLPTPVERVGTHFTLRLCQPHVGATHAHSPMQFTTPVSRPGPTVRNQGSHYAFFHGVFALSLRYMLFL